MNRTTWQPLAAAVCAALALAACSAAAVVGSAAVVGGAAGAGTLLYKGDRRSSETAQADSALEKAGEAAVKQVLADGRGRVVVTSYFRRVLLTGEVPTQADWQSVDAALRALPGAQGVFNELMVLAPGTGVLDRSGDAMITSRVRTKMLNQNGVPSGAVKVLTEHGTTYIMGRLTPVEAQQTTEAVSSTEGVQRVVRIIDLIADTPAGGVDGVITTLSGQQGATAATTTPVQGVQNVQTGWQTGVQNVQTGVQTQVQGVQTGVQGAVQNVQTGVQGAVQGVQTFPVVQTPVVTPTTQPIEVQTLPPAQ